MLKYWSSVRVPLLALCSMLAVGVSRAEGMDYIDLSGGDVSCDVRCSIEQNIRKDIAQKFSVFGYIIDGKMSEMENNIIIKLQQYIDKKLDMVNSKTKNPDDTLNQNMKKIPDVNKELFNKLNDIKIKIDELEKSTTDHFNKLNVLDTVVLENTKLLNMTSKVYDKIYETYNMTHVNSLALKLLQNSTFKNESNTNNNNTQVACLPRIEETTSKSNEIDVINWSDCKEEEVKNVGGYYDYDKPFHPIAEAKFHSVIDTYTGGERNTHLHMRLKLKADYYAAVMLSSEREPKDQGLFFKLVFRRADTTLYAVEASSSTRLEYVRNGNNLSYTNPPLYYIKISDGTLSVRHDSRDSEPIVTHHDSRFDAVEYFGFDASGNSKGHATVIYGC